MTRQHRPIRRHELKKLSIIRNPGTGPLLERLREKPMQGPIGFHSAARRRDETPDDYYTRLVRNDLEPLTSDGKRWKWMG